LLEIYSVKYIGFVLIGFILDNVLILTMPAI